MRLLGRAYLAVILVFLYAPIAVLVAMGFNASPLYALPFTFSTTWYPFYLMPDAPKNVDKTKYYESKFGADRTKAMFQHMAGIGQQEGINFKFGGRTGNTRDSHSM